MLQLHHGVADSTTINLWSPTPRNLFSTNPVCNIKL